VSFDAGRAVFYWKVIMAKFDVKIEHNAHFTVSDASNTITADDIERKFRELLTMARPHELDAEETLSVIVVKIADTPFN
jgi:hypothetical protein